MVAYMPCTLYHGIIGTPSSHSCCGYADRELHAEEHLSLLVSAAIAHVGHTDCQSNGQIHLHMRAWCLATYGQHAALCCWQKLACAGMATWYQKPERATSLACTSTFAVLMGPSLRLEGRDHLRAAMAAGQGRRRSKEAQHPCWQQQTPHTLCLRLAWMRGRRPPGRPREACPVSTHCPPR